MAQVIVPVGLNLGPQYPIVDKPDKNASPDVCAVKFRGDLEELTPAEYVVWSAAFADGKRVTQVELGRDALVADVPRKTRKAVDVDSIVDDLLRRELLLEYDSDTMLSEQALRRLQMYPSAQGLGNEPGDPGWFHIGTRGEKLVSVSALVYFLWASSMQESSMWETCRKMSEENAQALAAGEDLDEMPLSEPIEALTNNVPLLVSSGCAYLDWVS